MAQITRPVANSLTSVVLAEVLFHSTRDHAVRRDRIDGWGRCHVYKNVAYYNNMSSASRKQALLLNANMYLMVGGTPCIFSLHIVVPPLMVPPESYKAWWGPRLDSMWHHAQRLFASSERGGVLQLHKSVSHPQI